MVAASPGDVSHIHITLQHVRHVLPSCCLLKVLVVWLWLQTQP